MLGQKDYLDARKAHDRELSGFEFLSDREDSETLLRDKSIKKYCFVRNPFSRVLSAYLNKIEPFAIKQRLPEHDPHFHDLHAIIDNFRLQNVPGEKRVNFFVFLKWIQESGDTHADNEHWIPQSDLLHLNTINYDFIGKFENIQADASRLLSMMNCELQFPTQEKMKFPPTRATDKLREYYSEREIQIAKAIYGSDFELLDYDDNPGSLLD
jgi:hypothetical protein